MMQHRILVMYIQILRYMKANQLEDRLVKSKWCGIRCSIPLRTSALYVRIENCLISILLYSGEFFHADLLTMEAHTPSPKPQRYQKKGGDWYNQDYVDGSKTRGKKGTTLLIVCISYILRFVNGDIIGILRTKGKHVNLQTFLGYIIFSWFVFIFRNSESKWWPPERNQHWNWVS